MDRCSIRDDPNLTSRPIIRFTWGINANRDVRSPSQRSRGLKSNRKSPDANKNGDSFHPPPPSTSNGFDSLSSPGFSPNQRKNSQAFFRDGISKREKRNFTVYYDWIKEKIKNGKKKERRKIVDSKRRNIISIMYKSKSNRTV